MPYTGALDLGKNSEEFPFASPEPALPIAIFTDRIEPPENPFGADLITETHKGRYPAVQRSDIRLKVFTIVNREMEYGIILFDESLKQRVAYKWSEVL